jgi:hypothetical protein
VSESEDVDTLQSDLDDRSGDEEMKLEVVRKNENTEDSGLRIRLSRSKKISKESSSPELPLRPQRKRQKPSHLIEDNDTSSSVKEDSVRIPVETEQTKSVRNSKRQYYETSNDVKDTTTKKEILSESEYVGQGRRSSRRTRSTLSYVDNSEDGTSESEIESSRSTRSKDALRMGNQENTIEDDPMPSRRASLTRNSSQVQKLLENLLLFAEKTDVDEIFASPVDADAAPGYYEIITHPMDISTIRSVILPFCMIIFMYVIPKTSF